MPSGIRSRRVAVDAFPFAIRQRVRFAETDLQGVVYYANYLVYAEVGRIAYLRELGLRYEDLVARGLDFTIGEASVKYHAPLRFDDEFDIRVRVGEIRRVSWSFEYAVERADGVRCVDMTTVQVLIDRATFKPARLTEELRAVLERAQAGGPSGRVDGSLRDGRGSGRET
jgi:acyl-CoA thioester hydrolase